MKEKDKQEIKWIDMPHEIPDYMQPYLMLLCEACSAPNEIKMLTRFQKILRKIDDEMIKHK